MNFLIMGFEKDKGELVYEQEFNVPVSDLMAVMQWASSTDCIGAEFPVSPTQAEHISMLAAIKLPSNVNLYVSSYE